MVKEQPITPNATDIDSVPKPGSTSAVPTIMSQFHCPYRQSSLLQQALGPDKMRVAFFLGAGCPSAIRIRDGDGTKPLIPANEGLTERVRKSLEASEQYKADFGIVIKRLADGGRPKPNIEEILTHVRALHEVIGAGIDGLSRHTLEELDKEICHLTTDVVNVRLPTENTPYHQLATWVGAIKRAHPVEIFTPNYDLLMEF